MAAGKQTSHTMTRKQRAARRRRKKIIRLLVMLILLLLVALFAVLLATAIFKKGVRKQVTLEAGSSIELAVFLKSNPKNASFVTDVSAIDVHVPGTYPVKIAVGNKEYESSLVIRDTLKPDAEPVSVVTVQNMLPDPKQFVPDENIKDATRVTVAYKETPDVSQVGTVTVTLVLKDEGNNEGFVQAELTVLKDEVPPVIEGANDIEIFIGDTVAYKSWISVTDDVDPNPTVEVDNSKVNQHEEGDYPVVYTAKDMAGNVTTAQIILHVRKKPVNYVEPEKVYPLADEVLGKIIKDSMTDMEKAFAIYRWTMNNINYNNATTVRDWSTAAYQGLSTHSGDCYIYFAVAKVLYDRAGIKNVDVIKSDTSHSAHFWSLINLGDGWYHVDCTPRRGTGGRQFFMMTDAELEAYSSKHGHSHVYDGSLYPERATKSVQDKVNYSAGTIRK